MRVMRAAPSGWQYQGVDLGRSQYLMRWASPDPLVTEVLAGAVIDRFKPREPCNEAKLHKRTAHRITFSLRLIKPAALEAADCLLNGAYGLRAQYCHSPEAGSDANRTICRALASAIRTRVIRTNGIVSEQEFFALSDALCESLAMPSAKVWFDEKTGISPEDGEVISDVWSESRANPERVEKELPELSAQQVAAAIAQGRSVPRPLVLDVKAAFVEPNGCEYVALSKRNRPKQIHLMGWT